MFEKIARNPITRKAGSLLALVGVVAIVALIVKKRIDGRYCPMYSAGDKIWYTAPNGNVEGLSILSVTKTTKGWVYETSKDMSEYWNPLTKNVYFTKEVDESNINREDSFYSFS